MTGFAACEECDHEIQFDLPVEDQVLSCPNCGHEASVTKSGGDRLEDCVVCGESDFYKNAMINPTFGIFMVGACFVGFLAFVYFMPGMRGFLLGASILLAGAVIDRLLRLVLPEAAVCYHCKTVYSNVPNIEEFDVHDQEKRAEIEAGPS